MRRHVFMTVLANQGPSDAVAPTLTIETVSVSGAVASMRITASEAVTGFTVGDITSSGSLASFSTADNIVFTVSWTLAAGTNTMDISAGVCEDAVGNANLAADQYVLVYLALQPDGTAGVDTMMISGVPLANFGIHPTFNIGDYTGGGANKCRALIKFDLSSIPAGSTIYDANISLYATADGASNARTYRVFRQKRAWLEGTRSGASDSPETGATWIRYGLAFITWQTQGGFGADDCEQTDIGSRDFTAAETLNQFKDFSLTASAIQEMITGGSFTNNGFLFKADVEDADSYAFASSDNATAGNRPKLAIVYRP